MTVKVAEKASLRLEENTAASVVCADILTLNLNRSGPVKAALVCHLDQDGMATTTSRKVSVDGSTKKYACLIQEIEVHTRAKPESGHLQTPVRAVQDQECRQIQIVLLRKTWT